MACDPRAGERADFRDGGEGCSSAYLATEVEVDCELRAKSVPLGVHAPLAVLLLMLAGCSSGAASSGTDAGEVDSTASSPDGGRRRTDSTTSSPDGGRRRTDGTASSPDGGRHRTDGTASSRDGSRPPVDGGPPQPEGGGQDADARAAADSASSVYLADLGVTSSTSSAVVLSPAFSPIVHDYYVKCSTGANALTVSMTASPGATSQILKPTVSVFAAQQTLSVTVNESQAIVAAAIRGSTTIEYWVRCLPHDFPTIKATPHPDAGAPPPGYYLIGNEFPSPGGRAYAMVLDARAVPVWYLAQPQTGIYTATTGAFDVDSLVRGTISFISWSSSMASGPFQFLQLSPPSTTPVSATGWALDPHELRALTNGDFLLFTDQLETGVDLTGYNRTLPDGGIESFGPNATILPCDILEVDSQGTLVWTWIATDHLDAVMDNTFVGYEAGPSGAGEPDPFHCNSIDVNPANGNLLVSSRHMDSIFYVERSSGKILWKMGGKTYTKDNAAYVSVADPFYRQHDARLLPGWSSTCGGTGQISVFDDHSYENGPARAVVYDVNVGVSDGSETCAPAGATVAWQYAGSWPATMMGSFRILPDGSRIVGWGFTSNRTLVFTEVDSAGNDLFDLSFTQSTWSYRAIKVPLDELDLETMRSAMEAR